jgi:protein TonB
MRAVELKLSSGVIAASRAKYADDVLTGASIPEPAWSRSTRYVDQPIPLGTHLFGIGGVCLVGLLILGGLSLTWQSYTAAQAPTTLSVFDVALPAAPPEPEREIPPGPEQKEKEKPLPEPDRPKIEPPEIQIPTNNPITLPVPKPVPDPGPPVKETTAPEVKPLPPAPQVATGKPTWEGLVLGALNKAKRYPREAQRARQQGVPWIRFTMDRDGKVLSVTLERSSGFRALDEEAMALPRRASPLPKPPDDKPGNPLELVLPVEFFQKG